MSQIFVRQALLQSNKKVCQPMLVASMMTSRTSSTTKQPTSTTTSPAVEETKTDYVIRDSDYGELPDPIEYTGGVEKKIMLARLAGDDRYEAKMYVRGPGTRDYPNLIPCTTRNAYLMCICEPDAKHHKWWWIRNGMLRRCSCGHWFRGVDADPYSAY